MRLFYSMVLQLLEGVLYYTHTKRERKTGELTEGTIGAGCKAAEA